MTQGHLPNDSIDMQTVEPEDIQKMEQTKLI